MPGTFAKRTAGGNLPPAGAIKFYLGNLGPFLLDDSTNLSYIAANTDETAALRAQVGLGTWWLKES